MQCRVCMQSKCHILFDMNILGTEDGKNLYECFNECTQLNASVDDGLPKTLCKICAEKLQVAYNFRRTAKQSNEELKKLQISVKMETDSVDSTPGELCGLEDMGNSTADPLDMSFHEALKGLKESPQSPKSPNRSFEETLQQPLVEFSKETICLGKSSKSPNHSLEETLQKPLVEFSKETICLEKSTKSPNLSFEEALQEPLLEFPEETICIEKSSKSPNRLVEETLLKPLMEFTKETICIEKSSKSPNRSFEKALQEPLLEFPKEKICLVKSSKSPIRLVMETRLEPLAGFATEKLCLEASTKLPNRSLDEAQIEIVREIAPVTITETQDISLQHNDKQINVIETNEFEIFDSFSKDESESETEPIEKVGYACEICKSTYTIKNDLKKHIADQHKSEVICISCSKVYDMPNELRIHKKLVHETDSPVQCDYCSDKPIMPRTELLKHFQTVHSSRYFRFFPRLRKRRAIDSADPTAYQCKFCKNTFSTGFDLEEHIRSHVFRCPICLKNFNRYCTYYAHVKRLHNCTSSIFTSLVVDEAEDKPIKCKPCNKSYTRLGSYKKHMKQKHHKIIESTDIIDIEETMDNEIEDIIDQHHKITESTVINDIEETMDNEIVDILDIQEYKVSLAKKESEESPSLADVTWEAESKEVHFDEFNSKSEQNNVADEVPKESVKKQQTKKKNIPQLKEKKGYLCSFCPRVLCSNVSLRTHEKTQHLDAKSDLVKECPICKKKLNMDYIKKHIRNVHIGERNSICDICGGTYKCLSQLRRHKLLHMTDRHLQCNACDMKFAEKSALTVHMRLHTGEMPFACHKCDRRFRIKTHLTYHLEKHDNIKKKCKVCGKEFACSTTLRKHSFEHTGNMPYKCTDCGYATAVREYITTHTLRKHDRKMTEDELFLMFKTNTGKSPRVKNYEYLQKLTENLENSEHSN